MVKIEFPEYVYHGTVIDKGQEQIFWDNLIDSKYWRNKKDFGNGFYTTIDKRQAEIRAFNAQKLPKNFNKIAIVLTIKCDTQQIQAQNQIDEHIFLGESLSWAEYIAEHRYNSTSSSCGCGDNHKDIIVGPMADNRYGNIENAVMEYKRNTKNLTWFYNEITKNSNNKKLQGLGLGNQIVFCNEKLGRKILKLEAIDKCYNGRWTTSRGKTWTASK